MPHSQNRWSKLFWPTLTTLACISILIFLGTWQLQRLEWKENLIQTIQLKMAQPPIFLNQWLSDHRTQIPENLTTISVQGLYDHTQEFRWLAKTSEGQIGYHLITPIILPNKQRIFVDRGWVPENTEYHHVDRPTESVTITGYTRQNSDRTAFTPDNNLDKRELYSITPSELANHLDAPEFLPYFITNTGRSNVSTYPQPQPIALSLRNFHKQYAITWYILALSVTFIYCVFVRRKIW